MEAGAGLVTGLCTLQVEDGVAVVRMQDVEARNTFHQAFVDELSTCLEAASRHAEAKVCVVCGLEDVWCAGGNREVLMSLSDGSASPYDLLLTRVLLEVSIPTIAAMAGHAVGGGLVFGLSCDMVVMGRESRYSSNFMDMGFTPGMGTTRLIEAAVGEHLAAEMMFGCQYFKGSHFEKRGLVNYVEPRHKVEKRAMKMASRLTDKPRYALTMLKHAVSLRRRKAFEDARAMESLMHTVCFANPETRAIIEENYTPTRRSQPAQAGGGTPEGQGGG